MVSGESGEYYVAGKVQRVFSCSHHGYALRRTGSCTNGFPGSRGREYLRWRISFVSSMLSIQVDAKVDRLCICRQPTFSRCSQSSCYGGLLGTHDDPPVTNDPWQRALLPGSCDMNVDLLQSLARPVRRELSILIYVTAHHPLLVFVVMGVLLCADMASTALSTRRSA